MKLIGVLLSPFVRRVAISLNVLDIPCGLEDVFVFQKPEVIRRYNPLIRIPVLVLDDGTKLADSTAILDEIDCSVCPERRLTPVDRTQRRRVTQTVAMALGCAEKAQWSLYESRVRPAEKVHAPWVDHNDKQVLGGFEQLDETAGQMRDGGWIAGTPRLSQADVTTAVAFTFADGVRPNLALRDRFPRLAHFAARCEGLSPFLGSPFPTDQQLRGFLSQPFLP